MSDRTLSADELGRALSIRDLTDPAAGPHALQALLEQAVQALAHHWGCPVVRHRQSPIVSVADNYDRLNYPPQGAARDARYTRYVCEGAVLRTQTSALIPPLLRRLSAAPPADALLACVGLVYRRDVIDRLHTAEPHQVDLWRMRVGAPLGRGDLRAMVGHVLGAVLPGHEWRVEPAEHPYTMEGLQMDVRAGGQWVEVGECGLALPALLAENGWAAPPASGLAMGLGLDRVLMLRKGIDDIRLLRSEDPRVAAQMQDLAPYRPVSAMPPVRRDLSLAVDGAAGAEELGDAVRTALGEQADLVESLEVITETPYVALPAAARERLGLEPDQKNVLLRVVLRALDRTLTHEECNALRDAIYAALHRGRVSHWAGRPSDV